MQGRAGQGLVVPVCATTTTAAVAAAATTAVL